MKLSELRTDGGTQTRDALNGETVAEYAEKMRTGVRFPAVVAFYDGADYWLADGFHRVAGATQAGLADLDVDVRQGDRREAILFSVGANDSHGLRRTNADKRRAVNVLLADPVWVGWSDREIAKVCGVGKTLVGELRPSLAAATSEESTVTYTTKHGPHPV